MTQGRPRRKLTITLAKEPDKNDVGQFIFVIFLINIKYEHKHVHNSNIGYML
uniref:Uncharacterized protein n=1 Tax=Anguilla anguilla TaxID=7936 RepID=A0A0E9PIE2_ANGAN